MKRKWTAASVVGLLLGIAALACILLSIFFQKGNNLFLNIGLILSCANLILIQVTRHNKA